MVAVNTCTLDGTAMWQLLSTPRAVRADVAGAGRRGHCSSARRPRWRRSCRLVSRSPFWAPALGTTLADAGSACACASLLGSLIPALGLDARDRVSATHAAGNLAGGQWTAFTAVGAAAAVPAVVAQLSGASSLLSLACTGGVVILTAPEREHERRCAPRHRPGAVRGG